MMLSKSLFIILFTGMLFGACKKKVESTQPTTGRITESVYASGVIKSKNQYQVYSTVAGLIQEILVKEGDAVKKGDPLFIIKNDASRLNAENAEISADFADVRTKDDKINELKGAVETSRTRMINDSVLLQRQRGLWAQQIGSKVELEQRELAFTNSSNNYQAAIFRLNDLQKQLQFASRQSQKLLSISKTLASDYVIRSQTDGKVYSISKAVGEIVNVQTPVAVIGDAGTFITELQIDETDITRIKTGQRALITMDSYKGKVFEATISKIDPIMNERTRTFLVEAAFVQQPPVLYPNLTAEANVVMQIKDNALTIPRAYLVDDSLVILANNEKRKVTIGLEDYQKVEITNGLSASETILKPGK